MSFFRTIEISNQAPDGLRFVTVKSQNLKGRGDITLFEPEGDFEDPLPLVILLHGVYGSHWSWTFSGSAHLTAAEMIKNGDMKPMVIAMPSDGLWGDGAFYTEHSGKNFEKWIIEDVVEAACEVSDLINKTSQKFIGGLSMGGFGALRIGAKYPKEFSAISGHSSATRFSEFEQAVEEKYDWLGHQNWDVMTEILKNREQLPPFRFDCGVDDFLIEGNRLLNKQLNNHAIAHDYAEYPGEHTWEYWSEHVRKTFKFFSKYAV
ncbi:MAG: alpha/beta hydrolase-fold protein [Lentisphaerales bacterium]|nr:alpha/beta hydrolase-fold protein [Lentisphaerales bacterium]